MFIEWARAECWCITSRLGKAPAVIRVPMPACNKGILLLTLTEPPCHLLTKTVELQFPQSHVGAGMAEYRIGN